MKTGEKKIFKLCVLLFMICFCLSGIAVAKSIELSLSLIIPPKHMRNIHVLDPWLKMVRDRTHRKVKIIPYYGSALASPDWRVDVLSPLGEILASKEFTIFSQEEPVKEYVPVAGQPGKDVEWVPTSSVLIDRMLDVAKVTPEDYVIDLGSGDGRIVISAAKRGARALGIEYNHDLVEFSRQNAAKAGVSDRATFIEADLFKTDFSKATVITLFLREDINLELRPRILDLKPGTRILSNTFDMGEWVADEVIKVEDEDYYWRYCTAYLWVVPARIGGTWKIPGGELILEQSFQMIKGTLRLGNMTTPVSGRINGDRINFIADSREYTGRVMEDQMEVEVTDGSVTSWKATRLER